MSHIPPQICQTFSFASYKTQTRHVGFQAPFYASRCLFTHESTQLSIRILVYLAVYLSVSLSVYPSIRPSIFLFFSFDFPAYPSIHLLTMRRYSLSVFFHLSLCFNLSINIFVLFMSVGLSVCLFSVLHLFHLFFYPSVFFLSLLLCGQGGPVSKFCLKMTLDTTAHVNLIGAKPIVQVKQVNRRLGQPTRNRITIKNLQTKTTGAAHHGTQAPPGAQRQGSNRTTCSYLSVRRSTYPCISIMGLSANFIA